MNDQSNMIYEMLCISYQKWSAVFFVTARNYLNNNNTRMLRSFRILTLLLFLSTIINSSHGKLGKSASVVDPRGADAGVGWRTVAVKQKVP